MTHRIRIVAPYRPFPPESELHRECADFDWIAAIRMMSHSAQLSCQCPVHVITDVDTDLPVPTLRYQTHERRLMLWYLEIAACYLESDDCDRDTVLVDSDQLIYEDLRRFFLKRVDLTILIRPDEKHMAEGGMPILNGVQFVARRSKAKVAAFYRQALAVAETLPEERIVWGADTDALRVLLEPLRVGVHQRAGLTVRMIDADDVIQALNGGQMEALDAGLPFWPKRPVLDFRWKRKTYFRAAYEATILAPAVMAGALA